MQQHSDHYKNRNNSLPAAYPESTLGQLEIWEHRCDRDCVLWSECGGSVSSPCLCIYPEPHLRKDCNNCSLVCRERQTLDGDSCHNQASEGLPRVLLGEGPSELSPLTLAPFLPLRTQELSAGHVNQLPIVGIELRNIIGRNRRGVPQLFKHFSSPKALRNFLRVPHNTIIIAILNGLDWKLEDLWRMDRNRLFQALQAGCISAITGPTFSVIDESAKNLASHNVVMQLRHNRIVRESWTMRIPAYPNLYWRSRIDLKQWGDYLHKNTSIQTVYRDFSLANPPAVFEPQFEDFVHLIELIGRPIHIILTGIGMRRVLRVSGIITSLGNSYTIASSEPIMMAISNGKRLHVNDDGSVIGIQDLSISRQELAALNLNVFTQLCNLHAM